MTPRRWVAFTAALLVAGAALYLLLSGGTGGRLAELIGEGGEKQLRDPMRAPRGGERVLVFALDGVGEDELLAAVRDGTAPRIAAALGLDASGALTHAHAVPDVLSILPSITVAAWSSVFTGEPPSRTGIPGNEWFAREEGAFYAPAPVTVEESSHALAVYSDDLVGGVLPVPTLFERAGVRSYVALSQVHRGADLLLLPDLSVVGELAAAAVRGIGDGSESVEQASYAALDVAAVDQLLETFERHGLPDLQVVYFPGIDLFTHLAEAALPRQRSYLSSVLDAEVGRVLDAYERTGALDDTWIVFVSDHGHTPVLGDDRHALGTGGGGEPPELLEMLGFRVRPFRLELGDDADFQAVLAYQGAMAYVYLADRSTCPEPGTACDWLLPPRLEEEVLAVARAFDEANRGGARVPALRGTLDLILAREPRPVGEDALPFRVWDGEGLVSLGDYLAREPRPDLLELESRLEALAAGPLGHRAGDVLLLTRSGTERPLEERYYFSAEYRSWHGSASAQDSRIPLVVARRGMPAAEIRRAVEEAVGERPTQLDVTPLILSLLGKPDA